MTGIYEKGLCPVLKVHPHDKKWTQISQSCFDAVTSSSFEVQIWYLCKLEGKVSIAMTYPWSYKDSLRFTNFLFDKLWGAWALLDDANLGCEDGVYMVRELLCLTAERWAIDLLTITAPNRKLREREEKISRLFPKPGEKTSFSSSWPWKFDKPVVFLSARVHPGEAPASFLLNGLLKIICDAKSPMGNKLR